MPVPYHCPYCTSDIILSAGQRFCSRCHELLTPDAMPSSPYREWDGVLVTAPSSSGAAPALWRPPEPTPAELGYKSLHGLTVLVVVAASVAAFLSVLAFVTRWLELDLLAGEPERLLDYNGLFAASRRVTIIARWQLYEYAILLLLFLVWLRRAQRNLIPLGADYLRSSSRISIFWFFVPLINLIQPFRTMLELWRASAPRSDRPYSRWQDVKPPLSLYAWWGCWVLGSVMDGSMRNQMLDAITIDAWLGIDRQALLLAVVNFACYLLMIWVVLEISRSQEETSQPPPNDNYVALELAAAQR